MSPVLQLMTLSAIIISLHVSLISAQTLTPARSVNDIGDPTREAENCGQTRRKSHVCDPDGIISEEQGTSILYENKLDIIILQLYVELAN